MPAERWAPPWERATRRVKTSSSPTHGETELDGVPELVAERVRLQVDCPDVGRTGALVGSGVVTIAAAITGRERSRPWWRSCGRSDHHVLPLLGPSGAGKSMLARRRTTLLPAMTLAEALETTRIHRVARLIGDRTALVTTRPCRAPHQTISDVGLTGGSRVPTPGEVSRAHHGMLFLDALPELQNPPGVPGSNRVVHRLHRSTRRSPHHAMRRPHHARMAHSVSSLGAAPESRSTP